MYTFMPFAFLLQQTLVDHSQLIYQAVQTIAILGAGIAVVVQARSSIGALKDGILTLTDTVRELAKNVNSLTQRVTVLETLRGIRGVHEIDIDN